MREIFDDGITACEKLLISLCRQEQARNLQNQSLRLETWQPNNSRKNRVRQFITLRLDEEPLYIAKIPLSPEDHKVAREYEILEQLKELNAPTTQPLHPVARGFIMRYLGSEDFPQVLSVNDNLDKWLELVTGIVDAIIAFQSKLLIPETGIKPEIAAQAYVDDWQPSDDVTRQSLAVARVGAAHGDLGPWNVRYDRQTKTIGIIDWEDFRPHGLPALDILNFVFTLPLLIYPDYRQIGFERLHELTFHQLGLFSHVATRGLNRYARAMKVRTLDLVALLPLYYQAMIVRIRRENRPVHNLFYTPFQQLFSMERIVWLSLLEQ
jgi:aminoglycoside phosphotransferase (APT) family kinase protein